MSSNKNSVVSVIKTSVKNKEILFYFSNEKYNDSILRDLISVTGAELYGILRSYATSPTICIFVENDYYIIDNNVFDEYYILSKDSFKDFLDYCDSYILYKE